MNVVAFLYESTIIVGAISRGHGTHYNNDKNLNISKIHIKIINFYNNIFNILIIISPNEEALNKDIEIN